MGFLDRIPVHSNIDDTKIDGTQPVTQTRIVDIAYEDLVREQTIQRKWLSQVSFTEREKHSLVWAADRLAAELCAKGKASLYGNARHLWIAGRCGLTVREVVFILRR